MLALRAGLAYFALVFGTGFMLGAIRVTWLVPRLGVRSAELLEMPLMAVVIVLAARFVVRRFALPPVSGLRLAVGAWALCVLLAAELTLAAALGGQTPAQYVAGRDPVSGSVYGALLIVMALLPWLLAREPRGATR
jgi:hypothetical protein